MLKRIFIPGLRTGRFLPRSIAHNLVALHVLAVLVTFTVCSFLLYLKLIDQLNRSGKKELHSEIVSVRTMLQSPNGLELLQQELAAQAYEAESLRLFVRVLDRQGGVVLESPGMGTLLPAVRFPAPDCRQNTTAKMRLPRGELYLMASARLASSAFRREGWQLQVAEDITGDEELARLFRHYLVLFSAGALFFAILSAILSVKRALLPLNQFSETIRAIKEPHLSTRVDPEPLPVEMRSLASSFNYMMEHLEESFLRLSHYSGNLAHELRTPINTLMLEADIALSRDRTPQEYRKVIESSLEEYSRLASITDRLLFLARADIDSGELQLQRLELDAEFEDIIDYFSDTASEAGIALESHGSATLYADQTLFRRALSNLVSNALSHTPPGGRIEVSARNTEQGMVEVSVRDSGCGIEAEHLPLVFRRFYRADAGESRRQGAGLGLAIVKAIMRMHGGDAVLLSEPGEGTTALLQFPLKRPA
jgi:two-component system, OmpR family, heavy metal sensor histidine kinase CusS